MIRDKVHSRYENFTFAKKTLHSEELYDKVNELKDFFLPVNLDDQHHNRKKIALNKLEFILNHCNRSELQGAKIQDVVQCSLTTLYYYGMNTISKMFKNWLFKRQFLRAEHAFKKTIDYLLPEKTDETLEIILSFIKTLELWPYEYFVGQILRVTMCFSRGTMKFHERILSDVHVAVSQDARGAKHRMRTLYELLGSETWPIGQLLPFVKRLLDSYFRSVNDQREFNFNQLRKGFELCLRRIFERVDNRHRLIIFKSILPWLHSIKISGGDLEEVSSVLEYLAELYTAGLYEESFDRNVLEDLTSRFIVSEDHVYSLVGCTLLHTFLDRHRNLASLSNPSIFFRNTQVNLGIVDFLVKKKLNPSISTRHIRSQDSLQIGRYTSSDMEFIRRHRELIHDSLLAAVKHHGGRLQNIKAVCTATCCTVVEVPCRLTATAAAYLAMEIQEFALNDRHLSPTSRYWLHGVVASVLSLICWVHEAPALTQYVHTIIGKRAREAPQLNPPLLLVYNMAHNHVTWNKAILFFEDWELRYGLWKHFQDVRHVSISKEERY